MEAQEDDPYRKNGESPDTEPTRDIPADKGPRDMLKPPAAMFEKEDQEKANDDFIQHYERERSVSHLNPKTAQLSPNLEKPPGRSQREDSQTQDQHQNYCAR
jgi:hypothetical protein